MTKKETHEWAIQLRLPISVKEWLDRRAKRHHRSKIGELRTIIQAAMAPDLGPEIAREEALGRSNGEAHDVAKEAAADAESDQAAEVYSDAYAIALKKSDRGAL